MVQLKNYSKPSADVTGDAQKVMQYVENRPRDVQHLVTARMEVAEVTPYGTQMLLTVPEDTLVAMFGPDVHSPDMKPGAMKDVFRNPLIYKRYKLNVADDQKDAIVVIAKVDPSINLNQTGLIWNSADKNFEPATLQMSLKVSAYGKSGAITIPGLSVKVTAIHKVIST